MFPVRSGWFNATPESMTATSTDSDPVWLLHAFRA
jgi:hypothetical protein